MTRLDPNIDIPELISKYGSPSSTAWLEFERYQIWRPADPIPESSFTPVQGYMVQGPYAFAWGNPLVSHNSALVPTAHQFISWIENQDLHVVWLCVDEELEEILALHFGWSTLTCINEDIIEPGHVIEMTGPAHKGVGGVHVVKDLKKNLRKAQALDVDEVKESDWTKEERKKVKDGIAEWKKSRSGVQLASTTLQPWLDSSHRRYWVAKQNEEIVGVLILTPIRGNDWQVKNAVSFPDAPKGTSEKLIFNALRDLHNEELKKRASDAHYHGGGRITFGLSAAKHLEAKHNLSGWGVNVLTKIYDSIISATGLPKRGEFRGKFLPSQVPKYVCYPPDGFGMDGAMTLLKVLKK